MERVEINGDADCVLVCGLEVWMLHSLTTGPLHHAGDLIFVFNFHPVSSFTDYKVGAYQPGPYKVSEKKRGLKLARSALARPVRMPKGAPRFALPATSPPMPLDPLPLSLHRSC